MLESIGLAVMVTAAYLVFFMTFGLVAYRVYWHFKMKQEQKRLEDKEE